MAKPADISRANFRADISLTRDRGDPAATHDFEDAADAEDAKALEDPWLELPRARMSWE